MGRFIGIGSIVVVLAGLVVLSQSVFTVDEVNYAIVRQFGQIRNVNTDQGLHFKLPFVQQVTYLDRRILTSDTSEQEYLTSDEKRIVVDQVTRWRIDEDQVKRFFLTAQTELGGQARLEPLVLAELRAQIAARPYDVMISGQRDQIMDIVRTAVQARVDESRLGIVVVDVRTKRADLPGEVEQSVYDRMASARQVEADRHRAQGQLRSDQITSQTDREVQVMLACAARVSTETRGAGDAAAIAIFAEALKQDPDFFSFIRRLEAYTASFSDEDRLVLSTDSNFFQLLSGGEAIPIPEVAATEGAVVPLSADIIASLTQEDISLLIDECTPETVGELAP